MSNDESLARVKRIDSTVSHLIEEAEARATRYFESHDRQELDDSQTLLHAASILHTTAALETALWSTPPTPECGA